MAAVERKARELAAWVDLELAGLEDEVDDGAAQRIRSIRRVVDRDLGSIAREAVRAGAPGLPGHAASERGLR